MFTDPKTGEKKEGILRVRYSHDAMIDLIIATPGITQREIARIFDHTEPWISNIVNSDAFKARLAERKGELIDPSLVASIDERLRAVADKSLSLLVEKLNAPIQPSDDFVLKSAELASKALGYGARQAGGGGGVNVAVVVQVPPKIASSDEWSKVHQPAQIVEMPK